MISNFSEEQIIERLRQDNPWWATGLIYDDYAKLRPRLFFDLFYQLVTIKNIKRAVILMGPRRVGKTVMLYHSVQKLIESGVSPHKIAYISVENPFYSNIPLEFLFNYCKKGTGQSDNTGWYIIFDEIQYRKDWEIHLKSLVDSYPSTKFIASGSSAAALKLKSNESGAGRFTDFMLPSLTFHEYIHLLGHHNLINDNPCKRNNSTFDFYSSTNIAALNEHFIRYINFGGYPEVVFSEFMQSNPSRFVKSDIIDKVLLRDLPSLYGIQDVQELNQLFTNIAYYTGQEFTISGLSQSSGGIDKATVKKYIDYLEASFLIKIVNRIDNNAKKFQRVNQFKIYLTNPSLRTAMIAPVQPMDKSMGAMVETAIYSQWLKDDNIVPWYAHWSEGRKKGEVDLVVLSKHEFKPEWALEIKWSNKYFESPGELKSLMAFSENNNLKESFVTTIDKTGTKVMKNMELHFIPASLFAYSLGKYSLENI